MNRGDLVRVRAYPDKNLERIVWEEFPTYVLVVRPEIYHAALHSRQEPEWVMGFPKEDVFPLISNSSSLDENQASE